MHCSCRCSACPLVIIMLATRTDQRWVCVAAIPGPAQEGLCLSPIIGKGQCCFPIQLGARQLCQHVLRPGN